MLMFQSIHVENNAAMLGAMFLFASWRSMITPTRPLDFWSVRMRRYFVQFVQLNEVQLLISEVGNETRKNETRVTQITHERKMQESEQLANVLKSGIFTAQKPQAVEWLQCSLHTWFTKSFSGSVLPPL